MDGDGNNTFFRCGQSQALLIAWVDVVSGRGVGLDAMMSQSAGCAYYQRWPKIHYQQAKHVLRHSST